MPMPKNEDRCTFTYADGRRCRMCKIETHPYLCFYHWQRGQNANDAVVFASQLLPEGQQLNTAATIATVLTGVFRLAAQSRLEARQAGTLAYICQLAIQVLPHLQREAQAAEQARSETSPIFDTIQKGSFEENYLMRALNQLRGKDYKSKAKWVPLSDDEQAAESPAQTSEALGASPRPQTTDEPEPIAGAIPIPGTSLSLPPPLQREPQQSPEPLPHSASLNVAVAPPAAANLHRALETDCSGDLVASELARTSDLASPDGSDPFSESPPDQPCPITPEEELLKRREQRARDFGPPILTPARFLPKRRNRRSRTG